jgi:ATP-dependent helicase/DNAse subunit B
LHDLKPNDIGGVIHDIIYTYFLAQIKNKKISINDAVNKVFADDKYVRYWADERNVPLQNALKREVNFIIPKLEENLTCGDFKPAEVEYDIKRTLTNGYELRGRIDRLDKYEDSDGCKYYAVLDYKTGTADTGLPKKIYMGEKLQLPLYSAFFIDNKSGNLAGAGYLPLSKGFAKGEKTIQLNGFVDKMYAALFDRKVGTEKYKSKIINQNQTVISSVVENICRYADIMVEIAVRKITDGYIVPNPIDKDICKFCMVKSVCPRCEMIRRDNIKVDFNSFALDITDENDERNSRTVTEDY